MKRIRIIAAGIFALLLLACGGGGLGGLFTYWGMPNELAVVQALIDATHVDIQDSHGIYRASLPPNINTSVNASVFGVRPNTMIFANSYLVGSSQSVVITNVNSGQGGTVDATPVQVGNNIELDKGFTLPSGRWRMELNGPFKLYSSLDTEAATVAKVKYEFDVFGNGFSNIPIRLSGDWPLNGKSSTGFAVTGEIPPNNGQGPATLELKPVGGLLHSYTTNKALGSRTWTWDASDNVSIPETGYEFIGLKMNF